MSSGTCHLHRFVVVLSGEQIQIPDLRFARHKYLQGSRKEHLSLIFAQCTEVGCIHLIVNVFLTVKILHISPTGDNNVDQFLNPVLRQNSFEIQQWNPIVTAKHIHGSDIFIDQLLCPSGQMFSVSRFQGIYNESRQKEVIGDISLLCYLLIYFFTIAFMDLRQKFHTVRFRNLFYFVQQLPGVRLIQKIPFSRFLRCIGKCIQSHNFGTIPCQCL